MRVLKQEVFIFQLKLHAQFSMKKFYNLYNLIWAFFLPDFVDSVKWCFIDCLFEFMLHIPVNNFSVITGCFPWKLEAMRIKHLTFALPTVGFEPGTYWLQVQHSSNWDLVLYCQHMLKRSLHMLKFCSNGSDSANKNVHADSLCIIKKTSQTISIHFLI